MTRLKLAFLATGATALLAVPAQAQQQGHNMPGMTMPMPAKRPAVKKSVPRKPVAKKPVVKKPVVKKRAATKTLRPSAMSSSTPKGRR